MSSVCIFIWSSVRIHLHQSEHAEITFQKGRLQIPVKEGKGREGKGKEGKGREGEGRKEGH
jgi:hypothetical protein